MAPEDPETHSDSMRQGETTVVSSLSVRHCPMCKGKGSSYLETMEATISCSNCEGSGHIVLESEDD